MIEQHKYDGGITGWWCRYEYPNGKQCGEHRGNTAVHLPDAPEMLDRTIPFEGQALFPKSDPPQYHDYPPEMLDARLYVFEGQNFVSEKDYRAMMQLAEGFRLERDDYKCRWWRAHGELMVALGAPMTDRQNTAMKEISEIPDSKILEVLREQ